MVFIDALNCGGGGSQTLLRTLHNKLGLNGRSQFLDNDTISLTGDNNLVFPKLLPFSRKTTAVLRQSLRNHIDAKLLCLGNIPPPSRVHAGQVITYFHNALIIGDLRRNAINLFESGRFRAIEYFIRRFISNTDEWVVQTHFIKQNFCRYFGVDASRVSVIPFFDELTAEGDFLKTKRDLDFVYVSSAASHKNHARLFQAWEILAAKYEYTPSLSITVDNWSRKLRKHYDSARNAGAKIVDFGTIPHIEVRKLLYRSRWCIYPSIVETIGLGLLESAQCGCGVMCSNTGFAEEIIERFRGFDPFSVDDIVSTVLSSKDENVISAIPRIKSRYDLLTKKLF
jgi:glycosyltransferase involved in cell wall biosynthesis